MKKSIFFLPLVLAVFYFQGLKAQNPQCDSIQLLFDDALSRLDSLTGSTIELQKQLGKRSSEIDKMKTEVSTTLRKKNDTAAELAKAQKLISELNLKIEKLETEVKRLTPSSKKKPSSQ